VPPHWAYLQSRSGSSAIGLALYAAAGIFDQDLCRGKWRQIIQACPAVEGKMMDL
jgi:hypothetical protein